jgi:hypothetical protein
MKKISLLLLCLVLVACSSGSSTPPSAASVSVTEDFSVGLKGVDANSNGIRDDIDALIATKYAQSPAIKKAAEQKALALQAMMEATTKETALAAFEKISIASKCLYTVLPENTSEQFDLRNNISKDLESLTANTRERLVKYLQSGKLVGGGYISAPVAPFCN